MPEIEISVDATRAVLKSLKQRGYRRIEWFNQDINENESFDGVYKLEITNEPLVIWPATTAGRKRLLMSVDMYEDVRIAINEYAASLSSRSNIAG